MRGMKPHRRKQLEFLAAKVISDTTLCRFIYYIRQNAIYSAGTGTTDIINLCSKAFFQVNCYWEKIDDRQFMWHEVSRLGRLANKHCRRMEKRNGE